jgi:TolB-like protein/Tfp pilus assembly protein PilF
MIGKTISHYKILEKLGEGGMGVVYKAKDTKLGRTVALKFLPTSAGDREARKRFVQEAKAASSLDHPNVCSIHEIDETPEGRAFIVMPCYEGESLRAMIDKGPMVLDEALSIATQVASGLSKAHEKGIVHRDIKPGNILVTTDGLAKVLDFGVAKLRGGTRLTRTGTSPGTPAYMSPEQLRGEEVDPRSDIWSLGVVLYEMVTGKLPFGGDYEQAVAYAIMNESPKPAGALRADLPAGLERPIKRALSKKRDDRYQTSGEFIEALQILEGQLAEGTLGGRAAAGTTPSIAVLPFANMSPDPENQYFGDGLAEELINALAQINGLRVAARTSAFRFRSEDVDIREIGEKLNVRTVLEGSVRKAGNRLRVTAQLINIEDGYHLWSKRFDCEMKDIFEIQDDIARAIVDQLKVELIGAENQAVGAFGTKNLEAYTAFLEGRFYFYSLTPEGWAKGLELLRRAVELDPSFAAAHGLLSNYYQSLAWWGNSAPNDVLPKSREAAQKAIALDPKLGLAHIDLALVLWNYDWDFPKAEREFRLGLELDPTSGWGHLCYALFTACRGRKEEAIAEARLCLKLEPLSSPMTAWAASALFGVEAIDEATVALQKGLAMDPEHWLLHHFLGSAHLHASRVEEAKAASERAVALSEGASVALTNLGVALYLMGKTAEADRIAERLAERSKGEYVSPCFFGYLAIAKGKGSDASAHLRRAIEEHDLFLTANRLCPPQARFDVAEVDALLERSGSQ